jgi:hypothetical protein
MKRAPVIALSLLAMTFSIVMTGCDGGGPGEGMPADTKPGVPLDSVNVKMSPMKGAPPKGSETGDPVDAKKK